jgi:hypothetical protein
MTVRILCRVPGRADLVLTLQPGHYEQAQFGRPDVEYIYPPHVGILLLEVDGVNVAPAGMHIDEQHAAVVEQLALGGAM